MVDTTATMDFKEVQDDLENPPAKRPCLDPQSAASNLTDPAVDDGSDFYNTPLNAGTPIHTAETTLSASEGFVSSQPSTPQKPRPQIPGLTLCNGPGNDAFPPPQTDEPRETNGAGSSLRQVVTAMEVSPTDEPHNEDVESTSGVDLGIDNTDMDAVSGIDGIALTGGADKQESTPNAAATLDTTMQIAEDGAYDGMPSNLNEDVASATQHEDGKPEWEADSSPYESSSSSDSSDTSSSDDSDSNDDDDEEEEDYEMLEPEAQAQLLMAAEGGSDDEGGGKEAKKAVRTANEKEDESVPIPDITVTPDTKVEMLGNVETIVGNIVLVKANISGEYQVLESGSVLCLADLNVIGVVSETLGKVEQPMYTVRFSSAAAIKDAGIEEAVPVFYVVDHSTFVFTQPLKGLKGSDASNLHDEEIGEEEVEFSDDEAEAEHKRQLKLKRQQKKGVKSGNWKGRGESGPGPSGLRNSELNYDDADMDDGYTPLARPKNLHEMMPSKEPPLEESQPHMKKNFRGGRGKGRSRGYDRGGRNSHGRGRGGGYQPRTDRDQEDTREQRNPSGYPLSTARQNQFNHQSMHQQQQQQQQQQQPQQEMPPYIQQPQAYSPFQQPPQIPHGGVNPNSPSAMQYSPQSFPFMQPFQQQQAPSFPPPGSHINPAFFANANPQSQPSPGLPPPQPPQNQGSDDTFAAAQAQLDLLRRLSRGDP